MTSNTTIEPHLFIIVGATGDLATRKILYLALPPVVFPMVITALGRVGLNRAIVLIPPEPFPETSSLFCG